MVKYVICGIAILIILVVGVIVPLVKRMRCTEPVTGMVTDQRIYYIKGISNIRGKLKYSCKGEFFVKDVFLHSRSVTNMKILVNPKHPKEWVLAEKSRDIAMLVISVIVMAIIAVIAFLIL